MPRVRTEHGHFNLDSMLPKAETNWEKTLDLAIFTYLDLEPGMMALV